MLKVSSRLQYFPGRLLLLCCASSRTLRTASNSPEPPVSLLLPQVLLRISAAMASMPDLVNHPPSACTDVVVRVRPSLAHSIATPSRRLSTLRYNSTTYKLLIQHASALKLALTCWSNGKMTASSNATMARRKARTAADSNGASMRCHAYCM